MISLFFFILIVTFLRAYVFRYVPMLYEVFSNSKSSSQYQTKKMELRDMEKELSEISMTDEWAKYAKLQRKINKSKSELSDAQQGISAHREAVISTISKVLTGIFTISIVITVMYDRSAVVAQIPENWLGWPFFNLFCWSNNVPGGITIPCWVIMSSRVAISLAKIEL